MRIGLNKNFSDQNIDFSKTLTIHSSNFLSAEIIFEKTLPPYAAVVRQRLSLTVDVTHPQGRRGRRASHPRLYSTFSGVPSPKGQGIGFDLSPLSIASRIER